MTDITTHAARLIIKAAIRYATESPAAGTVAPQRAKLATARLNAFAEVAADIDDLAMTPFAFAQAIRGGLSAHPFTPPGGMSREAAEEHRLTWGRAIVADVLARLGRSEA